MMDSADPTDGWSLKTFLAIKAGPAKQDVYGQLHHYLKRLFADFHHHLRSKPVSFELHHIDAKDLGKNAHRATIRPHRGQQYLRRRVPRYPRHAYDLWAASTQSVDQHARNTDHDVSECGAPVQGDASNDGPCYREYRC